MAVAFDPAAADRLIAAAERAAGVLRDQALSRNSARYSVMEDFEGPYATLFWDACLAESEDRVGLAGTVEDLGVQARVVKRQAEREAQRQIALDEWRKRQDERRCSTGALQQIGDGLSPFLDPMPSTEAIRPTPISAAYAVRTRLRVGGGRSSGRTSARPDALRRFAAGSRAGNRMLEEALDELRRAWAGFLASCSWARVDVMTCVRAFERLLAENAADANWADRLAESFEQAGGASLPGAVLDLVTTPVLPAGAQNLSPERAAEWWRSLSPPERALLKQEQSLLIGNLNGIPFEDRIAANAESARHYLQEVGLGDEEKRYWQDVIDGAVQLVVLDRERGRIVEMLGEIGPNTTQVVTYVPGTTTRLRDFYSGKVKRVPSYLAKELPGCVVFVYKDFSSISWLGNLDEDGLAERGRHLAGFDLGAVGTDSRLAGLPQTAIGYSAGMPVVGGSELHGARFDRVISLGGSYVPDEWRPNPGTQYTDIRYKNDILNHLDRLDGLNSIYGHPDTFEPVHLDSPNPSENNLDRHGRLGGGPDENEPVLDELRRTLRGWNR